MGFTSKKDNDDENNGLDFGGFQIRFGGDGDKAETEAGAPGISVQIDAQGTQPEAVSADVPDVSVVIPAFGTADTAGWSGGLVMEPDVLGTAAASLGMEEAQAEQPVQTDFSRISEGGDGALDLTAVRSEYLNFDHFQFKLAVIQVLMYELKLLGEPYHGGSDFMDTHEFDYENATDEEMEALKQHRMNAKKYFEDLKIPSELADQVEDMCLDPSNEIYYEIDPMHGDFDLRDWEGRPYYISDISDRELFPFKNLKGIVFNGFNDGGVELIRKLRNRGIDAQDSEL